MTAAEDQARRLGCALVEFRAYDLLARPPWTIRLRDPRRHQGLPGRQRGRWYRKDLWTGRDGVPPRRSRTHGTSAELDALVSQRSTLDDTNQGLPTGGPAATPEEW